MRLFVPYPAIAEQDGDTLGLSFPDFPGCVTAVETGRLADLARAGSEALALHIEGMLEDGDPIPQPSEPQQLVVAEDGAHYLLMIPAAGVEPGPAPTERVNVLLPKALLGRIDLAATEAAGGNRSAWLAEAAREKLAAQRAEMRTERGLVDMLHFVIDRAAAGDIGWLNHAPTLLKQLRVELGQSTEPEPAGRRGGKAG